MDKRALVLEGGGMRGVFTAGVLDYFLDENIEFPYVVGVSAGCANALSFLSKQRGRTINIHTEVLDKYHYIGLRPFLKSGEFIDMDFLYNELLEKVYPFDFDVFAANEAHFESVTTNAITGEVCYVSKPQTVETLKLIGRASGSLPFVNHAVNVDGVPMLDGGVVDSIPLEHAITLGYKDAVVVLTQCLGFRKKIGRFNIPKWIYKYPKIIDRLNGRARYYNSQMERVEEMERQGLITVIRPTEPLVVKRLTTDTAKLTELYEQGYSAARVWHSRSVDGATRCE